MAFHANPGSRTIHERCRSTRATRLFWLVGALLLTGRVVAQEPAPETAPPPASWGGAPPSETQSAATSSSMASGSSDDAAAYGSSGTPATEQPGGIKDASLHTRPQMVSVFTGLHYGHFSGYGFPMMIGGRYLIPIVPDGFIPSLNDEFGLEFGLDLNVTFLSNIYTDSLLLGFGIPADAMWDFHITPSFDAYAKLGFVIGSVFRENYGGFWWTFRSAVGLRLKLNEAMYFRAEVGYPAVMAGLGFAF